MTNYEKFESIHDAMKKLVEEYEVKYSNNKYSMTLANGDHLEICAFKNNIAHMLGLKTDTLKMYNFVKSDTSSYDALKYFLENMTYISTKNKLNSDQFDNLFSKYVDRKLNSFTKNICVRTDDMCCVVKYNKEKTYMMEDEPEESDYFLIRQANNNYYVLGIKKMDDSCGRDKYVPMTSRVYSKDDQQEFEKFMAKIVNNQEVTYPYVFKIENRVQCYSSDNLWTSIDQKIIFVNNVNRIAEKYNGIASVGKEFASFLSKSSNINAKNQNNYAILRMLIEAVRGQRVLGMDEIEKTIGNENIPEDINDLILSCNDLVLEKGNVSFGENESYSVLANENTKLKAELQELKEETLKIKSMNDELSVVNAELKSRVITAESKWSIMSKAFEEANTLVQNDENSESIQKIIK